MAHWRLVLLDARNSKPGPREESIMSRYGWNYLTRRDKDRILKGIRDGVAYGGPFHLDIQPSDRCNIDCFFCSTASLRGADEIPLPRIAALLLDAKRLGVRSVRLSGGGEPLVHRGIKDFLKLIVESGLRIENLTTNAVPMRDEVADRLLQACDEIIVSLNTADAESYARMMQTKPANFGRVLENVRSLLAARAAARQRTPRILLQFLVWKENYRSLPAMYRLARELRVDGILFNGLSFLKPEQHMTPAETDEMMGLYEDIVREDEYRRIVSIESYEQDLHARVAEMDRRVGDARPRSLVRRAMRFFSRHDYPLAQKWRHLRSRAHRRRVNRINLGRSASCLIGWYSLVVRPSGDVAPCCILQGKGLGNVYRQTLEEVWQGEPYRVFRAELSRIATEGVAWQADPSRDRVVEALCGEAGKCPIAVFYYWEDVDFMSRLQESFAGLREAR